MIAPAARAALMAMLSIGGSACDMVVRRNEDQDAQGLHATQASVDATRLHNSSPPF